MAGQVRTDLPFRFGDKAQTPSITEYAACCADRECASVPNRTEQARAGIKLGKALLAPGQVIEFFIGSPLHLICDSRIAGDDRVSLVQALGGNFAGVVNTHQASHMRFLRIIEIGIVDVCSGVLACRPASRRGDSPNCVVEACEQPVDRCHLSFLHGQEYSNAAPGDGILRGPKKRSLEVILRSAYILSLLVIAAPLLAAEEEEAKSPWSGSVKLGYLATSGNTDSSSLNAGFQITYTVDLWQHEATAAAIQSTEANATTAEAYDFGWKSARNLTEHDFIFGRLDWRKDRFSSYDQQFSQALGYGRRLINTEAHQFNAELGIGARQSDIADGTKERELIVSGRLTYNWQISETARFGQAFVVESGSSNTFSESATKLSARLIGGFALVASYTVRHNSDVLPGTEKTDTFTALSLEYAF